MVASDVLETLVNKSNESLMFRVRTSLRASIVMTVGSLTFTVIVMGSAARWLVPFPTWFAVIVTDPAVAPAVNVEPEIVPAVDVKTMEVPD